MKFLYLQHAPGKTPQTVGDEEAAALRRKQDEQIARWRRERPAYLSAWLRPPVRHGSVMRPFLVA